MKTWTLLAATLAVAASAAQAKEAKPPTPLFASDAPIRMTIQGPMSSLVSNRSATPRPATMTVDGVTYPITLTPRGITRLGRDICEFPPLRVDLTQPAPPGSLFERQKHLKLTVFCKRSPDFQQKILLEYAAYRLYNLMTPESFRARLANIDYLDETGKPYISRVGFFVEDFSDVAKRNGMAQAHMGALVPLAQIDAASGARFALFEDMISNYDWSMRAGPKGTECCHNARLMSVTPGAPLIPVPYDFDFSGLVDTSYATPPEGILAIAALKSIPNLKVWERHEVPKRLHYGSNPRIQDVIIEAEAGYSVGLSNDSSRYVGGAHGYDNENPDMHGIFFAQGPSFKKGYTSKSFINTNIYNIITHILNLQPAKNDGNWDDVKDIFKN